MNKDAFISAVRAAGIVGEGGAGFPAHVKYAAGADTVIANGCECEPLLHGDHHVMKHHAPAVCGALRALADAVGAGWAVLALKRKHGDLLAQLRAETEKNGLELFLLEDFYPAGDEQILVREVTGRSVPPLGIPLNVGAVVANVATLADVGAALGMGASDGAGRPMIMKTLTVTGDVRNPAVMRAPLGTPLAECLEACGGAISRDAVFIIGGPMMGWVIGGPEALMREAVSKTTGGLIAVPHGHPLHLNATRETAVLRRRAASACIQCRACSDLCPRNLIGHPFETHRVMRAFAAGAELESQGGAQAMICSECGVCEQYACPMGMSPRRINQAVKAAMRENGLKYEGPREICEESTRWRDYRKVPVKRLASRLGIGRWLEMETPFLGDLTPAEVRVSLRQHIGAAAVAVVEPGRRVTAGDLIGEIPEGALGARVHAGISGTVTEVSDFVRIRRD